MKKVIYISIVSIGLLQIIGFITTIKPIRNLGAITASSPLPIVFTEVKGVETFASDFYITFNSPQGVQDTIQITPELYSKLKGPYNRRNIYGAAIAYGPVLPKNIWTSILNYGLCNDILKKELDIPITSSNFSILIKTRTEGKKDTWVLKTKCSE